MCAFPAEQVINVLLPIEFGFDRKYDFLFLLLVQTGIQLRK